MIANSGDLLHGSVIAGSTDYPGWLGVKTHWVSDPTYQGPFIVRAERIDRPASVALGGQPTLSPLLVTAGPTANNLDGWRDVPSATWVHTPGCYAWQVDGETFSHVIIMKVMTAAASPR